MILKELTMGNMEDKELEEIEVEILPFLAEAIATNPKTYEHIDKIYNNDKLRFIKLAKNNEFYTDKRSTEGSIKQEYYYKKALGVLIATKDDKNIKYDVIKMIKKCWKYTATYIQNHKTIYVTHYLQSLIKKRRGIDKITDDEFNSNLLILLFIATYEEKEIEYRDEQYKVYWESILKRREYYEKDIKIDLNIASKQKIKKIRESELKAKNKNSSYFMPNNHHIDQKYLHGLMVNFTNMTKDEKYYAAFGYIFDLEDINLISIIGSDVFKSKEMQELIYCYYALYNDDEEIPFDELYRFLYPAIQIRYLCRAFKKSKEYFFKNFDEELYEEINKTQIETNEVKKKNLLLQDKNYKLSIKNETLKKENERLKLELEEANKNKEELVKLREFVFELDNDYIEAISDQQIEYNELKDLNALIIGGHIKWQNKMKEYLPNSMFINTENMNFDLDLVNNSERIFIYTSYLNHGMYYKVINEIRKKNIRLDYLKAHNNVEIVLKQIMNKIS